MNELLAIGGERMAREDSAWTIVRAHGGAWEPGAGQGLWLKPLFRDAAEGRVTALARLDPGVRYPAHRHAGSEELYMLDGDFRLHGRVLRAGDYCAGVVGSVQGESSSEGGRTFPPAPSSPSPRSAD